MSNRRLFIGIAGLVLGTIGLAALWFPVYLDQFDSYGIKVSCGNGIGTHLTLSHHVDGDAFASPCNDALLVRRVWAFPAVAIGWALVTWFVMMWAHVQQRSDQDDEPEHTVPHPEIA